MSKNTLPKIHKWLGVCLFLPFLGWTVTGLFFFIKPGYSEAFSQLSVKQYSLTEIPFVKLQSNWEELRIIRTVIGNHYLAKIQGQFIQVNPEDGSQAIGPAETDIRSLINDAIADNSRYGSISTLDMSDLNDIKINTSGAIEISFNWNSLQLRQKGLDTDFINAMYSIHYLQWTGHAAIDKYAGTISLFLVLLLSLLGLTMTLKKNK